MARSQLNGRIKMKSFADNNDLVVFDEILKLQVFFSDDDIGRLLILKLANFI